MKKQAYILFFFGCLTFLINSCTTAEIPLSEGIDPDIKITYSKDVQPIIFNNCLTCHSTVNPRAGIILTTYLQVKNSAQNGNLIVRMNSDSNPMPQSGKLIQTSLDIIDKWKTDGFLE